MKEATGLPHLPGGSCETGDLVHRAQEGDPAAFKVLYEATVDRVFAICLRMSGNTTDAEDLTQEVYIRCWKKLALFRGEGQFRAWLYRLAINHTLNKLHQAKRIDTWHCMIPNIDSLQDPCDIGIPDIRIDLERALAKLSANGRQLLMRKYVTGYRYRELAQMEDLAVGTLKSQVHRARKSAIGFLGQGGQGVRHLP